MNIDLSKLTTEGRNAASANIDMLSTEEMLKVINAEDQKVALAVEKVIPGDYPGGRCHCRGIPQGRALNLLWRRHFRSAGDP